MSFSIVTAEGCAALASGLGPGTLPAVKAMLLNVQGGGGEAVIAVALAVASAAPNIAWSQGTPRLVVNTVRMFMSTCSRSLFAIHVHK